MLDGQSFGSPDSVVAEFVESGTKWVHIVDLDLAFGRGDNQQLIAETINSYPSVNFQISGGISDSISLDRAIRSGAKRINIASQALSNRQWLETVAMSGDLEYSFALDVLDDRVVARGTKSEFGSLIEVLGFLSAIGIANISVTDANRDGMLNGPNLTLLKMVSENLGQPVISSGGLSSLDELEILVDAEYCCGAVLGKALYSGNFSLQEALAVIG